MAMNLGQIAYMGGLGLAVILSFMSLGSTAALVLVVLGLIAGYLNIKGNESVAFLLSVIALPLVAVGLAALPGVSGLAGPVLVNVAAFATAAAVPVILMTLNSKLGK